MDSISFDTLPEVEKTLGLKISAVYQRMQSGLIPRPVMRGRRAVAWPYHEIQAIARARLAGKTDAEIRQLVIDLVASRSAACPASAPAPTKPKAPAKAGKARANAQHRRAA